MRSNPKRAVLAWHCVLDRELKLLYLGTDLLEAERLVCDGSILRSARTMGDAMRDAAIACAEATRHSGDRE